MTNIRKKPDFPTKMLLTYLYRTSVEDYFRFLEQKVSRCSPAEYKIFREKMCCCLGVHKTESLRKLMYALYSKLSEVQQELDDLYDDEFLYGDVEEDGNSFDKRLEKKLKERGSLCNYLYLLFVQPLLYGLGDAGTWGEQMRQRLGSCHPIG